VNELHTYLYYVIKTQAMVVCMIRYIDDSKS